MAKYRLRTKARIYLPFWIGKYIHKGKYDCGDHEWYTVTPNIKACYHCRAESVWTTSGPTIVFPTQYNSFGR